jgi:predicted ATPase
MGLARALCGICTAMFGSSSGTVDQVMSALDEYRGLGYQIGITASYILLCEVLLVWRQFDAASKMIEQGLSICNVNSEQCFEAELYRLKARAPLLLGNESNTDIDVQSLLDAALTIARSQRARSLELRAALDLARLWRDRERRTEARDLLAPIYGWFIEGFDTFDLKEAKSLLDQLA